jgi:predicted acyltransferase
MVGWRFVRQSQLGKRNRDPLSTMTPSVPIVETRTRLGSLDALRGFDMFWILGADALVLALGAVSQSAPVRFLTGQLEHKEWEGFAFYDLIFPLFVFIVGVSLVFSLTAVLARESRATAVKRILRRAAVLFLLGIFYNGGLTHVWPEVRLVGVLQRIALAYAAAGILFCFVKPRSLAVITVTLLLGYWALLAIVPIRDVALDRAILVARLPGTPVDAKGFPDEGKVRELFDQTTTRVAGRYEPGLNLPNHVDYVYLPGGRYDHYYDPEGIVSTLPAIATCLLGVFAGLVLQRGDLPPMVKLQRLLIAGVVLLIGGWIWNYPFPVIKKLWTSSYVLVAGGWSFLLLGAFYYVVDIRQWRRWCQPFVWIGMNPITLYLLSSIVSFHAIASRLVGGSVNEWLNAHTAPGTGAIIVAAVSLFLVFAVARFLYVRKIFLRV